MEKFTENIKKWSLVEEKLKSINEHTKKLRTIKNELNKDITQYMNENNLTNKKINLPAGEVRLIEKKEYGTLSFSYIELCLENIIADKEQIQFIINYLREQRDVSTVQELRLISK
uniref:Uncharacterized protein n=1 Tax=viral metagenome TaxID=1070528 RepID=A0A6C0B2W7_9ZZZZ